MDLTWSEGLSNRMKKKKRRNDTRGSSRSQTSSMTRTLPEIRPNTVGAAGELSNSASMPALAGGRQATAMQKGFNLRVSQFMDRQLSHSSIEARKAYSVLQREIVKDGRAADDVEFWGNKGVEGFQTYLKKKYGSIVAGWRRLDVDKNGRLSFYEFCNACRAMGFGGNLKKLWRQLDTNGNGFISLIEIDPEVGHTVGTFKLALMKKYGDMLTAWKKGLDVNGTGRIEEAEIDACLQNLRSQAPADHAIHGLSARKLFGMLRCGGLGLTLQEFDPDSYTRAITGDVKGLTLGPNKEFIDDLALDSSMPADILAHPIPGGARAFRRELNAADQQEVAAAQAEVNKLKLGLHTADGFKAALINRCGSLLGAWRTSLDFDGNERLTFGEFTQALHRLGFHGNITGLWKELDVRRMGYIVFGDLDKDTDDALIELREKLCKEYGNMLLAWLKGLDVKGTNCVEEWMFANCCEKVGFSGDAKDLFRKIRPEAGRSFLTLKDFDTKAFNALHRGDFRMISEADGAPAPGQKKPMEMTFHERSEAGFFFQIRRAWDAAKRAEFAKACRMANLPDHLIASNEAFEALISRKYGSIISAWRNCLDADHNGKLTFNEFCQVVRWLGYGGDLKVLWRSYDKDKKGFILLKDLDPDADTHVNSLLNLLNERYGDLDSAWRDGFNKDPHDSIDEAELKEACESLGYPHDCRKLFKCLQPVPGRQLITIWDLDPACSRKRAQGKDTPVQPSWPKSPTTKTGKRPMFGERGALDEEGGATEAETGPLNTQSSFSTNRPNSPGGSMDALRICRQALRNRHGSTVAAWRAALDPELAGIVSKGKLLLVLEDCAFHGQVNSLWADLAGDKSQITLADIDPDAATILEECREFMVIECGSILKAWHTILDPAGAERVDKEAFLDRMMGKVKSPGKLFRLLLARQGQRSLAKEDFEALLITVPAASRMDNWAGKNQDDDKAGSRSRLSDEVLAKQASPRHHVTKMTTNHHGQDKICNDLTGFKKILMVKYGSLFAAWRNCLDVDQNGVVTQIDFAKSCQQLGIKATQKIWAEFDKNADGQISLFEVDAETAQLFNPLEQLLLSEYSSIKEGWRAVFDTKGSLRCDLHHFKKGCQSLGFEGDSDKLFKLLRPEPGRSYLAFDDLWIDVNKNDNDLKKAEPNFTQGSPRSARSASPQNTPAHARSPGGNR